MNNEIPKIERFAYFACKSIKDVLPMSDVQNPRKQFEYKLWAIKEVNEELSFNFTSKQMLNQMFLIENGGYEYSLCNYYVNNEWPVKMEVEVGLYNNSYEHETETEIENFNNLDYCRMPDSEKFLDDIENEIQENNWAEIEITEDGECELEESNIPRCILLPEDDALVIHVNEITDEEDLDDDTSPYSLQKFIENIIQKAIVSKYGNTKEFLEWLYEDGDSILRDMLNDERLEDEGKKEEIKNAEKED